MTFKYLIGAIITVSICISLSMGNSHLESYERTKSNAVEYFTYKPPYFSSNTSSVESDIPLVIIETESNAVIPDEPKISADMRIVYEPGQVKSSNDEGNVYSGKIGIEVRGAYSATLPQKPYGLETRDEFGENLNAEILGLPKENDWILLANYNDKTFLRNALAFKLFREMGHYAPRTIHAEVVVNGEYQGIYVFTERIKRDKNRIDIARLKSDDISGDQLTGGYIFKVDYYTNQDSWVSNFQPLGQNGKVHFVYHDPEFDELAIEQKEYIANHVDAFENVLYGSEFKNPLSGYASFIDVDSFVDYFIMGELSRNVDAYKKSCYYNKDKQSKGGLIKAGPIWDQDWAWKNINECFFGAVDGSGWAYDIYQCNPYPQPPTWIYRLLQDTQFRSKIVARYQDLRQTTLGEDFIYNYVDSVASVLNQAQERHYQKWDILGRHVGAPEVDDQPQSYAGEISKFKNWITTRLSWMDANITEDWAGEIVTTGIDSIKSGISVIPNPSLNQVRIETTNDALKIEVYSIYGSEVITQVFDKFNAVELNISHLESGMYFGVIKFENQKTKTIEFYKK